MDKYRLLVRADQGYHQLVMSDPRLSAPPPRPSGPRSVPVHAATPSPTTTVAATPVAVNVAPALTHQQRRFPIPVIPPPPTSVIPSCNNNACPIDWMSVVDRLETRGLSTQAAMMEIPVHLESPLHLARTIESLEHVPIFWLIHRRHRQHHQRLFLRSQHS